MKIDKEKDLKTLWYEDKDGNEIDNDKELVTPNGAAYQVSRFPKSLTTTYIKLVSEKEVESCKHPRKHIHETFGWVDGIKGRECKLCYGTQTKKKWHPWGKKWNAYGGREIFSGHSTWNDEKTILAMVNSGDFTLSEAIIVYATSCEKCMNVLVHKYTNGEDGYAEYSEEWKKCGTSCKFCSAESEGENETD